LAANEDQPRISFASFCYQTALICSVIPTPKPIARREIRRYHMAATCKCIVLSASDSQLLGPRHLSANKAPEGEEIFISTFRHQPCAGFLDVRAAKELRI
jgi:hypothetical protein